LLIGIAHPGFNLAQQPQIEAVDAVRLD